MGNKSEIKGNGNFVLQGIKKSKVGIQNKSEDSNGNRTYGIIGIVLAFLTLLATMIIGWDNILKFFTK